MLTKLSEPVLRRPLIIQLLIFQNLRKPLRPNKKKFGGKFLVITPTLANQSYFRVQCIRNKTGLERYFHSCISWVERSMKIRVILVHTQSAFEFTLPRWRLTQKIRLRKHCFLTLRSSIHWRNILVVRSCTKPATWYTMLNWIERYSVKRRTVLTTFIAG